MMNKWLVLSMRLRQENDLLGTRILPENLATITEAGRAACVENSDGEIIAFAATWYTPDPLWGEVGSVWVHSAYRGRGLAAKVFRDLIDKSHHQTYKIFLITHEPKVVHLSLTAGLVEVSKENWNSVPWAATCGECDRWATDTEKFACPFRALPTDCRLFKMP